MNDVINKITMYKNLLNHNFIIQPIETLNITDSLDLILVETTDPIVPWITVSNCGVDFTCIAFESSEPEFFDSYYIHDLKDGFVHMLFDSDYDRINDMLFRDIIKRCFRCQYGIVVKDCNK